MILLDTLITNVAMLGFYIMFFVIIHNIDTNLPENRTVKYGPFKFVKLTSLPKSDMLKNWYDGEKLSLFNLLVSIPVTTFIASFYMTHPNMFTWYLELFKMQMCFYVIEIWFYTTHFIAHHKLIYGHFHKLHHKYTAPVAINALYANPIDFVLTSVSAVLIACVLIPLHMYTMIAYIFFVVLSNTFSHSGYSLYFGKIELISAKYHDDHHRLFNKNFGTGYFMDYVFGTEYSGNS